MKKLACLILGLALLSLACQTLLPTPTAVPKQPTVTIGASPPGPTENILTEPALTSTPRPTPEPITCTDDSCLNACLQRIEQAVPQTHYEPLTGAYAQNELDMNLVYYDVQDGQLGEPQYLHVPDAFKAYQEDGNAHRNAWNYASSLLTPEQRKWISRFEIFVSSSYSGWVAPAGSGQDDRSHWTLGVEITNAENPVGLTYMLVHEYGHMITLNTDQIPASDYYYGWYQNTAICPQFLAPDGCSKPDSYINLFYQKFWKDIFDAWLKEVGTPVVNSSEEFRGLVSHFYQQHPEQFVEEYAATNINEDLAESFMYFVLEPKPGGDSIPDQKIRFYYDFPELVALRQQMIQNVCSYTSK